MDYRFVEVRLAFRGSDRFAQCGGQDLRGLQPGIEQKWIDRYGYVARIGEAVRFIEGSDALGR